MQAPPAQHPLNKGAPWKGPGHEGTKQIFYKPASTQLQAPRTIHSARSPDSIQFIILREGQFLLLT